MNEYTQRLFLALKAHGCEPTRGGTAHCPAHDDRKASLSFRDGDKTPVLVKCHAGTGCKFKDIVDALDLKQSDLFSSPAPGRNGSKIVAEYNYTGEHGELLFQVVRYEPKHFQQRRPYDGTWAWGVLAGWYRQRPNGEWSRVRDNERLDRELDRQLEGVRRVLYRWPELLKTGPARVVFVVEGEKDVDRLWDLGLVATCSPLGAGKWTKVDVSVLHGRRVIVLPDNNEPGREHADDVVASLDGKAMVIKILTLPGLPDGGDVCDWIDTGGTVDELKSRARAVL